MVSKAIICFLAIAIFFQHSHSYLLCGDRDSSYPYISGDTFRAYADYIYDETQSLFPASRIKKGSTVFVKTDLLTKFFKVIHPLIRSPYILITHNSDFPAPGNLFYFLKDPKIIAWFGQNVENYSHPKLHPIPIGIGNRMWVHGDVQIWDAMLPQAKNANRDILLYMNFNVSSRADERSLVYNIFHDKSWCLVSPPKDYASYLKDLSCSKFVLSPRGNGLDCHRTWEALMMGAIPIVKTSSSDSMYADMPVVIIEDWNVITEEYLTQLYEKMQSTSFNRQKYFADYWFRLIDSFK